MGIYFNLMPIFLNLLLFLCQGFHVNCFQRTVFGAYMLVLLPTSWRRVKSTSYHGYPFLLCNANMEELVV
jgi:hypothetical protein